MSGFPSPSEGDDLERWGVPLRYAVDRRRLPAELADAFVPSTLDAEGEAFIYTALQRHYSPWTLRLHRALTMLLSDFDANGLLGTHPVFLLSTAQAHDLLGAQEGRHLLDIGAGSGDVTSRLAPLFESVLCTETSPFMARRLKRRGLPCTRVRSEQSEPESPRADGREVVALCNVIDRCDKPRRLLSQVVRALPAGGQLLLSSPLPLQAFFYRGALTFRPRESLSVESQDFETAAGQLWEKELRPLGLELGAFTRAPYLSGGDARQPIYVLDAAIYVCRKTA